MFIDQAREVLYYIVVVAGAAALSWAFMKLVEYLEGGNKK